MSEAVDLKRDEKSEAPSSQQRNGHKRDANLTECFWVELRSKATGTAVRSHRTEEGTS